MLQRDKKSSKTRNFVAAKSEQGVYNSSKSYQKQRKPQKFVTSGVYLLVTRTGFEPAFEFLKCSDFESNALKYAMFDLKKYLILYPICLLRFCSVLKKCLHAENISVGILCGEMAVHFVHGLSVGVPTFEHDGLHVPT